MSGHTPAPWAVHPDGASIFGSESDPRGRQQVADLTFSSPNLTSQERAANARLVAAAPELLAALKALCAWSDHPALTGRPDGDAVAPDAPDFDATVKMVHAVISKAQGLVDVGVGTHEWDARS